MKITQASLISVASVLMLGIAGCSKAPAPEVAQETPPPPPPPPVVVVLDPAMDALVSATATIDKVTGGYKFLEGPLARSDGSVWFSDLVGNVAYKWTPDGNVAEVLNPGGYDGKDAQPGGYIGPNGMVVDADGNVLLCQHGNRRIVKISKDGKVSTVIDRFEGKRLNSPNDLVFAPDGSLYFTDPPFGLPKADEDPAKEQKVNGVYRWYKGKVTLVAKDLALPNGIAFSPDYKVLYVSNSGQDKRLWMRYDVAADGSLSSGTVFADATSSPEAGVPDGMKVDSAGNVYATGPGGIWVFSADGKHLGTIKVPEGPSNLAWSPDGMTLYITAETSLYKLNVNVAGHPAVYN
jgi:gluconolactonase